MKGISYLLNDKALLNTAINQLFKIIHGPLLLVFIPLYLSQTEQGYWYAFTSLAALGMLADLGFSTIILQFAAHEFSNLSFTERGEIIGNEMSLAKLSTFLTFSIKWISCMIILVFIPIILYGIYFFKTSHVTITWEAPWIVYSVFSAIQFLCFTLLCFIEGCDSIAKGQRIRFLCGFGTSIVLLAGLWLGLKLYALAFSLVASSCIGFYFLYKNFKHIFKQLFKHSRDVSYSWGREFFPLIWRYAISCICGYLMFQIYIPLSFKYYSPIEAGQIGLSLALWGAIYSISFVWTNSKLPQLNMYLAKKEYDVAKNLFWVLSKKVLSTFLFLSLIVLAIDILFIHNVQFLKRVVPPYTMISLWGAFVFQVLTNLIAIYLRAHKKEPMVWCSILNATLAGLLTWIICYYFISKYIFVGLFIANMCCFPYAIYLYKKQLSKY